MDLYQLKTFVAVAREGTITRASEVVHLSQPAVSAHIKELEDALGLSLFDRTPRGMVLTREGQRLLTKAEQTLAAHQELLDEAARSKGQVAGKLRLGAGTAANHEAVGRLLITLAERFPAVEVTIEHGTSSEILSGLRDGRLDAGFYNEPDAAPGDLAAVEVARFKIFLVAAPGVIDSKQPLDWNALAGLPWIYPTASACCSRAADALFKAHKIRPARVISVDRQPLARTLIGSGLGVGLLHADSADEAEQSGEIVRLADSGTLVRTLFAHLSSRAKDPILAAASSIIRPGRPPARAR